MDVDIIDMCNDVGDLDSVSCRDHPFSAIKGIKLAQLAEHRYMCIGYNLNLSKQEEGRRKKYGYRSKNSCYEIGQ